MFGRFALATAGLLLALTGWSTPPGKLGSAVSPRFELPPSRYYSVEAAGSATAIDLPGDSTVPCELIIGSLGDSARTYRVQLEALDAPSIACGSLREVEPLQWMRRNAPALPVESAPFATCLADAGLQDREGDSTPSCLARRTFSLHVADTPLEDARGYTDVAAELVCEGKTVRIYRDAQLFPGEVASGLEGEIVRLFDERIIPRSREVLGVHRDIDGDGKLAVLLTPWLGRLQGGRTSVNGFVRGSDFQRESAKPFGNSADVLYLNSALRPEPELVPLLAHEYTHAVCFSLRRADHPDGAYFEEDDWLNEAIAHVAERLHGGDWSNLDHRVQSFLAHPHGTPLVVRDYYRAGLWRDPGCRGATYLFLQWCLDGFGADWLRDVAGDPRTGIEKIEALTGESFPDLFRHWTIALHRGQLASIDLRGRLGACELSGPRHLDWNAGTGKCALEISGTSSAFVRCTAPDNRPLRLLIRSERGARLQVTVVRPATDH